MTPAGGRPEQAVEVADQGGLAGAGLADQHDALARPDQQVDTIESRLLAAASLACMRSSLRHWLASDHDDALPALIDHCFERLSGGLIGSG